MSEEIWDDAMSIFTIPNFLLINFFDGDGPKKWAKYMKTWITFQQRSKMCWWEIDVKTRETFARQMGEGVLFGVCINSTDLGNTLS